MFKKIGQMGLCVCLALSLAGLGGCAQANTQGDTQEDELAVATVNGEELSASLLTTYIESVRSQVGSDTDAAWEAYLEDAGYTVDEFWEYLIQYYATEMLVYQKCEELGIEVTDEEIDERIESLKTSLGATEENSEFIWEAYVEAYYDDEDDLRGELSYYLLRDKLYEREVESPEITDEIIQAYADAYISSYTSTRSSAICFDSSGTAQEVLEELQENPDADFEAYCEEYCVDDALKAVDGDVGWSAIASLPDSYLEALEDLEVGSVYSELVWVDDYCYIVKATDYYDGTPADGESVDLSAMPEDIYEQLLQDVTDSAWSITCNSYLESLYEKADIEILIEHQYDIEGQSHG